MDKRKGLFKESMGIFLSLLVLILFLSFISYYPKDSGIFTSSNLPVGNLVGKLGAIIADLFFNIFGLASYLFIIFLALLSYNLFAKSKANLKARNIIGYVLLVLSSTTLLHFIFDSVKIKGVEILSGGLLGKYFLILLIKNLNVTGASLTILYLFLISLIVSFNFSLKKLLISLLFVFDKIKRKVTIFLGKKLREREHKRKINKEKKALTKTKPKKAKKRKKVVLMPEETKKFKKSKKRYELPPLSLLDSPPKKSLSIDKNELSIKKQIIEEKLSEYNINGKVVEYHPGPVISTFEFKPDRGVKISQVISRAEDLSLALKARDVRIGRIKGKSTLGIEIPNYNRNIIYLKEILESTKYRNSKSLLTTALGKNIRGTPIVTDLSNMPHLLIAGATGMGKSVTIHSIILSIIFRATPEEVNFVLVDPKRLEFSVYENLPHLRTKVVLDPKQASTALKWAIYEMEERLRKLALFQCRNIMMFNRKIKDIKDGLLQKQDDWAEQDLKLMPYIIIIIDELADLMLIASKDVENSISRLAQTARAAGIHLILATQRPSTDIITGTIKNNLPSRIALTMPSRHDSQTVIDTGGAEKLLGKGDMLFMPPASSILHRVHGSFVSEEEVARVVKFLSKRARPSFDSSVLNINEKLATISKEEELGDYQDPEFIEAMKIVVSRGKASASYLQRRMKIGYNKAARFVEMMEEKGIVGQKRGSKPREVLVDNEYLEQFLKNNNIT